MSNACFEVLMSPLIPATDNVRIYLSIISILASLVILLLMRSNFSVKMRIGFTYLHIAFLIFPVVLYTTHSACGYFCFTCYSDPMKLILLALPTTIAFSTLVSLFTIPFVLTKVNGRVNAKWINKFCGMYSKYLGIRNPKIYVIDKPNPVAFSFKTFKSAIFLSVGMLETFTRKEVEAVLLHELMHIKRSSSILKFSSNLLKMFSPFYNLTNFHIGTSKEERIADSFAVRIQGTRKNLISAKKKSKVFEKI